MDSLKHFVTVEHLDERQVGDLIELALAYKTNHAHLRLRRPVYVANLFFENSTRTHTSFAMAQKKLGLNEIAFDVHSSSTSKGESLYDTALTLDAIGLDLLVIRHSQNEYYNQLIHPTGNQTLAVGIINAGDGSGQHPSQCMLDMMTIYEKFHHFAGLNVVICGDITNSRVAKSNMQLLKLLGANLYFAGPAEWYDHEFDEFGHHVALDDVIGKVDVVMLLRVQHERHSQQEEGNFDAALYHQRYGLNQARYERLKDDAIIMHPGPINRGVEISDELVEADKSMFKRQMQNGVFMRMAMLSSVLVARKLAVITQEC